MGLFEWTAIAALAVAPDSALSHERSNGGPLPFGTKAVSVHAPYAVHDCLACHVRQGSDPGPLREEGDPLCLSCHDTMTQHAHAFRKCSKCHNAHDSMQAKLLVVQADACPSCHVDHAP
jgi:predicted CXXCH cytochrome family protein